MNGVPQGGDMGGWRITWMLEDWFVASNQMQVQAGVHRKRIVEDARTARRFRSS